MKNINKPYKNNNNMWQYQIETIGIKNPTNESLSSSMNLFGEEGWEIFSLTQRIVEQWNNYGVETKIIEFTLYMKRKVES
jgi:hypothetical protein